LLIYLSIGNAIYTFRRKRHYRLFENSVDTAPSTPSAHRVRVDSLPVSSSPLRFLTQIIGNTSAESRSHPDPVRDVWEIVVWDPLPICLRLFCLFSPGHVLVYSLFLPVSPSDPRPSTTVATTLALVALLSAQLLQLQLNFSQQAKDTALIQKEVLNEYDIKFVHARLNHPVRDVKTQFSSSTTGTNEEDGVDTYTPTTILRRGFRSNPNPNYTKHIDPDNTGSVHQRTVLSPNPNFQTPQPYPQRETAPLRNTHAAGIRQPQFRQSTSSVNTNTGGGGSLGIFSHANSPLKKATSMNSIQLSQETPRNSIQMARKENLDESRRSLSPIKRLQASDREIEKENARERSSLPPGYRMQHSSTSTTQDTQDGGSIGHHGRI
jgi:Protein of unknown function (DUF2418)